MDAPNLDAMTDEDARKLRSRIALDRVGVARELFPSRPRGYVHATGELCNYLGNMLMARSFRIQGRIEGAQRYESVCDLIYNQLPKFARW